MFQGGVQTYSNKSSYQVQNDRSADEELREDI